MMATGVTMAQQPAAQPNGQQPPVQKPGVPGVQHPMSMLIPDAEYPINGGPDWLAAGEDPSGAPMVWTNSRGTDTVFRMDPLTNKTVASVPMKKPCSGLVVAMGALWAPSCEDGVIHRIDGATNKTIATIPAAASNSEGGIAFGAGSIWLPIAPGDTLARIDPKTNTVSAKIKIAGGSHTAVFGYGLVWVSSTEHHLVSVIHPATNQVIAEVKTDPAPRFMAAGEGYIWTLNQTNGTVSKIDPLSKAVVATIPVGVAGTGGDIAAGEGAVWVTARTIPMSRIDPIANKVTAQFYGSGGDATRVLYGSVWLSNGRWGNVWRFNPKKTEIGAVAPWLSSAKSVDLDADGKADLLVENAIVWHVGEAVTLHAKVLNPAMGDKFVLKASLNGKASETPMTARGDELMATYSGAAPRWIHYSVCVAGKPTCSPDNVIASPTTTASWAKHKKLLVPDTFMAPRPPDVGTYVWHHLEPGILEQDYQFLVDAGRKPESIDKGEDYGELKRHQWEFQNASAFAYGVLTADETKEAACVYVNPSKKTGYDVQVRIWISKPGADPAFDKELEAATRDWIKAKWPFGDKKVAFPGTSEMPMDKWNALPDLND
jgi:hypothetical protein